VARLGLPSLGRSEAHVLASIDQVVALLDVLTGSSGETRAASLDDPGPADAVGFDEGGVRLEDNATELLGAAPARRATRIMVTMPSEAATDATLARYLIRSGMDCARINCALRPRRRLRRHPEANERPSGQEGTAASTPARLLA
jgi:pyruvate kinase